MKILMSIDEVKQIIASSNFNPDLKNRLVLLLPRLGKYTLVGLGKEVSRGDTLIIADYIVFLWENFANLLEELKNSRNNSAENLLKLLAENKSKNNGEDEIYALSLVLDIRLLVYSKQVKLTASQYEKLLNYEIWLFPELPQEEVLFLLNTHILYLSQKFNLTLGVQAVVYKNDWDYKKNFPQVFISALIANREMIGNNPIFEFEDKTKLQTVGNWLNDYIQESVSGSEHKTGSIERIIYMQRNGNAQRLAENEKKSLSEIFRLYDWLRNGESSEEEKGAIPALQPVLKNPVRKEDLVPVDMQKILQGKQQDREGTRPVALTNEAPKSVVDIDQKLEELSKKVKKRLEK